VSDDGLRAIASLTGLAHLHLRYFHRVTDEGVATLRSLTALKSLELTECDNVSQEAITALRQLLALDYRCSSRRPVLQISQ
jgi:F-box/leucine-rich repeat protein 14